MTADALLARTAGDNLATLGAWIDRARCRGDVAAEAKLRAIAARWIALLHGEPIDPPEVPFAEPVIDAPPAGATVCQPS